jgi:predicted phosphoribosyltransferase
VARAYASRADAGLSLVPCLSAFELAQPLVLGLARGGVLVAAEVARALDAPLEVFVVRKVGAPGQEELGVGAVAEGVEEPVLSAAAAHLRFAAADVARVAAPARQELARQLAVYRRGRLLPDLTGRDVIVVDDGLATGVTAEAAIAALRPLAPRRLILAVPVGSPDTVRRLEGRADIVVCPETPRRFDAVGRWYSDFSQTTDGEVMAALAQRRLL